MLRQARLQLRSDRDDQQAILICQAAMILHNLLIHTWMDNLLEDTLQEVSGEERLQRRQELEERDMVEYKEHELRRKRLVDQMQALDVTKVKRGDTWGRLKGVIAATLW